jgi:hypothetical protein
MISQTKLQFPEFQLRVKNTEKGWLIFDIIRKKYITLTPEEWVRQHVIHYLVQILKVSTALIQVEKRVLTGTVNSRFDIATYYPDSSVQLVVECKASTVPLTQETTDQVLRYSEPLAPDYIMITNGLHHHVACLNKRQSVYQWIENFKDFQLV